jgi:hypothetical protein
MEMTQIREKAACLRREALEKIATDLVELRFADKGGFVDPHKPLTTGLVGELLGFPEKVFEQLAGGPKRTGKRPKARRR